MIRYGFFFIAAISIIFAFVLGRIYWDWLASLNDITFAVILGGVLGSMAPFLLKKQE